MADRKISDLTALTTPASGDYLPIVDISESAAASKNKRITIEELMRGAPDGTAAAPSIAFESDPNTGIYSPGADQVAISTNGTGRLFVDASGNVGLGTLSPNAKLAFGEAGTIAFNTTLGATGTYAEIKAFNTLAPATPATNIRFLRDVAAIGNDGAICFDTVNSERMRLTSAGLLGLGTSSPGYALDCRGAVVAGNGTIQTALSFSTRSEIGSVSNHSLGFLTNSTTQMLLDTSGRLGIGTTSPSQTLDIATGYANLSGVRIGADGNNDIYRNAALFISCTDTLVFKTGAGPTERARIDSSGRLLIGTSSSVSNLLDGGLQIVGTSADAYITATRYSASAAGPAGIILGRSKSATKGTNTIVANGDELGAISFSGANGTSFDEAASVKGFIDGTPGASGDMPGRLVFSTTADGSASPTEAMRITNDRSTIVFSNAQIALDVRTDKATGTTDYLILGRAGSPIASQIAIYTNGNVENTNNSYGAFSDVKLKENIVNAGSQWDDLKALQVRKYNFKEGQTHTQIGLVAQEVELVSPGLVNESPDRDAEGNDLGTVTKSVNYSVLYMKAVKALQEAMERIEALEADVALLKGE